MIESFRRGLDGFLIAAELLGGQMQDFAIDVLQSKLLRDDLSDVRPAGSHLARDCDGSSDHDSSSIDFSL